MKRPPILPEPPAAPRRRRALSEEERTLWESVAKHAKPLRRKSAGPRNGPVVPGPETPAAGRPVVPPNSPASAGALRTPPDPVPPPLAPLGRRERSQLSRGKKKIEARLDLHGMTQLRAHRALSGFLQRAQAEGLTFVLVITGKGRASAAESERGVLRRQVPQWLSLPELRSIVVGFEEAHIGHGGEGALYVRIRRSTR